MEKILINAFADEASSIIDNQIIAMKRNSLNGLEIRNADGISCVALKADEAKEIRRKLVKNYMLRTAIYGSLDQLGPDCRVGDGGTIVYRNGTVRFTVFERTEDVIKIQLKGESNLKGKAEMQFEYSPFNDKVIIYY